MALALSFCCLPTLYAIPKVGQKSHIVKESASSLQRFNEVKTEDFIRFPILYFDHHAETTNPEFS